MRIIDAKFTVEPARPQGDLISRNALKKDFKERLAKCDEWIEKAKDKETRIRASTVKAFIAEVIMTIDNAPTVEPEIPQVILFAENMTEEEKQKLIAEFKAVMDNAKFTVEPARPKGDLISRKHLYRRIKTECNPYGKPTIDFESGKRVLDIIDNEPTVETYTEEDMRGDKNG